MKKLFLLILLSSSCFAQEGFFEKHPFVNQTEFGINTGKVPNSYYNGGCGFWGCNNSYYEEEGQSVVRNFEVQTYNGIYLNSKTTVGLVASYTSFSSIVLLPVGLGFRRTLFQKNENGSTIEFGAEGGIGLTSLNKKQDFKTLSKGPWYSPFVGYKFPMKNTSAILLNVGYKYVSYSSRTIYEFDPEALTTNTFKHNRVFLRLGFEF